MATAMRRWTVRNQFVPAVLQPHDVISAAAAAALQTRGAAGSSGPCAYPAELWLTHPDAIFYTIYGESLAIGPDTQLVLLTWKDEAQLVECGPSFQ